MQPNDQNPEQPQEPQSPSPFTQNEQTVAGSSMARIIQPLSSEDSIRSEVLAAQPSSTNQANETPQSVTEPVETYESGGLITEPIQRQQATQTQIKAPLPTQEIPAQKTIKKIPIALLAIAAVACVVVAYLFLFSGKISARDLVKETSGSTAYMRPKQWRSMSDTGSLNIKGFSDMKKDDTKAEVTSIVMLREVPAMGGIMVNPSDELIGQLRKQLLSQSSIAQLNPVGAAGSIFCDSMSNTTPEEDTKKSATTTGLITASSTCESDGKKVTTKMRVVIGKDGVTRALVIMARGDSWTKNEKVFLTMLDSIEQAS